MKKKKKQQLEEENKVQVTPTKYPVLLVHGMILKDFFFLHSFGFIKKNLMKENIKVYIGQHDGIGSIENNAVQLKTQILEILEKEKVDKINLIAHSKGGLDSRYMISKLGMEDKVASLTTLATPHLGSKLSATILRLPKWFIKFAAFFINLFYKIFKDKHPDIITVAKQLSSEEMVKFNEEIINSDNVYYQSYSSSLQHKKMFIMWIPYQITKEIEREETDGIVSHSSTMWGEYKGDMDVKADHLQMAGLLNTSKSKKEVTKFYLHLIDELSQKGF